MLPSIAHSERALARSPPIVYQVESLHQIQTAADSSCSHIRDSEDAVSPDLSEKPGIRARVAEALELRHF